MLLNGNHQEVSLPNTLCVVALLDSLKKERSQQVLDELYEWKSYFDKIQIPVYIITPDSSFNHCQSDFFFCVDSEFDYFKKWNAIKIKNVFGKEYPIIYNYLFLVESGKAINTVRRINYKSVGKLYLEGLKITYEKHVKKVKKMLDEEKMLW